MITLQNQNIDISHFEENMNAFKKQKSRTKPKQKRKNNNTNKTTYY